MECRVWFQLGVARQDAISQKAAVVSQDLATDGASDWRGELISSHPAPHMDFPAPRAVGLWQVLGLLGILEAVECTFRRGDRRDRQAMNGSGHNR